jgi:predicted ATPase
MFTEKKTFLMQISIKNLGIVETAEIELKGITVLSGHNDSGKSFIGKMLFSIIYTIKNASISNEENKSFQFLHKLERIRIAHTRVMPVTYSEPNAIFYIGNRIASEFNQNRFSSWQHLQEMLKEYQNKIHEDLIGFDERNSRIKKEELEGAKKDIDQTFETLNLLLSEKEDDETIYRAYFNSTIIEDIFGGKINCVANNSVLEVKLIEGSKVLVDIAVENNIVKHFHYDKSNNPLFKDDAILIETPTILTLDKYYPLGRSYRGWQQEFPIPYDDLLTKIRYVREDSLYYDISEVAKEIENIINGEMEYDKSERTFVYTKHNEQKISSTSVATGIKSFAILQMLLKNKHITSQTILILDEPEVHLHPAWEILYAKILFNLCKSGVLILLSTHSSYFTQAIQTYASDLNMEDMIRFYFGERVKDGEYLTKYSDVTNDLNPIFKALAKPMQDIYK